MERRAEYMITSRRGYASVQVNVDYTGLNNLSPMGLGLSIPKPNKRINTEPADDIFI